MRDPFWMTQGAGKEEAREGSSVRRYQEHGLLLVNRLDDSGQP
ncbi:hypothetical protein ACFSC4_24560 [Deinococcus malanensis]